MLHLRKRTQSTWIAALESVFPAKGAVEEHGIAASLAPVGQAHRNDKECVFLSLRAIRRIARQSQLSLTEFGNSPKGGNPDTGAIPYVARMRRNEPCRKVFIYPAVLLPYWAEMYMECSQIGDNR